MRCYSCEVAFCQVASAEIGQHLTLQRTGKVGDLPYRLLNVADTVNRHLKRFFIVLALGFEATEPLLQIG